MLAGIGQRLEPVGKGHAAVATASGLPRPTARRILLTLEQLGYVRQVEASGYELTPRVLDLGMSYVLSRGLWEIRSTPPPKMR